MDEDHPPAPASFVNSIELSSLNDSKIANVSVYTGRAEVTRIFKILVKTGQNQIAINELPDALDRDSIRVEGHGLAIIHDVSVGNMPELPQPTVSPALNVLMRRKDRTTKALERCKRMHDGLEKYLSTLHIECVAVGELDKIVEGYDTAAEKLDDKVLDLEAELKHIEEDIKNEQDDSSGLARSRRPAKRKGTLRTQVLLNIFADNESEIELVLIYAVNNANWNAVYDIRVDTQTKENPVTLIYKAAITQNTGEDWQDVTLTLETATPSFAGKTNSSTLNRVCFILGSFK
ncbi:hypothetical protein APHAL10511_002329 [Amanita phalloides]|nr:hypothetical protein APHAL10511_002329 [Amanita phalloides]